MPSAVATSCDDASVGSNPALPERRIVVRVDVTDRPKERFWLLLQRPEPELCRTHPGCKFAGIRPHASVS